MFYYSLQGPFNDRDNKNMFYYTMIVGKRLYMDLLAQNNGKRILMGLCVSYLQQRLMADKNPLLKFYNPQEYKRLAFYNIEKYSMEVSDKSYRDGDKNEIG